MARVGIGVPTYNGVDFIAECLACLQNQTFEDFEVFISDNGSTDGTSDICADFARIDKRFRHLRFDQTIAGGLNFSRARDMTSSPYFMWRADDDLAEASYLEGLVSGLDRTPDAMLAVAPILRIIQKPKYRETLFELPKVTSSNRVGRVRELLLGCHPSWFYGLWRRDFAVRDWDFVVREYKDLWASDHLAMLPAILSEKVFLSHGGKFIQRIQRPANYHLPPDRLLIARRAYKQIADQMVVKQDLSASELRYMRQTIHMHMERRVAPRWKNIRRAWRKRVLDVAMPWRWI
jgi:glycosyltransferase involved in cell wall biosynthesis